jgi:hypothetical protein
MCLTRVLRFGYASTLCLAAAFAADLTSPIPPDRLELVPTEMRSVNPRPLRPAVTRLLNRVRNGYALRTAGTAWNLKVTFTVTSAGQTEFDGAWQMEDIFDPQQGWRWTASTPGYSITRLSIHGKDYGTNPGDHIPLRLQEARAALFDPMPAPGYVARAVIRTTNAAWNGLTLNCVLISTPGIAVADDSGRHWDETEECIDPQSGLLQVHSQVPGRYYEYDYSNAPSMGNRILPRSITVTEAGKIVSRISVRSLTPVDAPDPGLFVPTEEMKANGPPILMAEMQKVFKTAQGAPSGAGSVAEPVCIFGLVTPSGQLVEAHSLQPSDPNSAAALADAASTSTPLLNTSTQRPAQHFVFIIESFVASP